MWSVRNFILTEFILFLFVCLIGSASAAESLLDQPAIDSRSIRPGEVLEYTIKVKGIPAGTQVLQVNGKKIMDGDKVYHVKSVVKAGRLFNIFYPFSNQMESFIHTEDFYPLHYQKNIRDGGYKGKVVVDFDQDNGVARIVNGEKQIQLSVPEGVQDELSMIYLLRTRKIQVGRRYEVPALIGTKNFKNLKTYVKPVRLERLETVLGTLRTIVVEVIPRNITIWLTNDSARIPVKMEVRTKIGKLVSNLKAVQ